MAEFPALPLFTDAYLGDTTHLTTIEHGAYFLLLITMWRAPELRLPDDDKMMARYTKTTGGQWLRMRPIIERFFRVKDGFWWHGRLTDELKVVRQKSKSQSDKARHKWRKIKETGDAAALPQHCPAHPPTPTPTEEKEGSIVEPSKKKIGTRFDLEKCPPEWSDWCLAKRPDLNPLEVFDRFRDYWIAKPGREGLKLDWLATWRNWVRNTKGSSNEKPRSSSQPQHGGDKADRAKHALLQSARDQGLIPA